MSEPLFRHQYIIPANDFSIAGEASSDVKKILNQLEFSPSIVKRVTIAMYEAEINAVIHAHGAVANVSIYTDKIIVSINDQGPGILDIDLAMKSGYSTAPDSIRQIGFGAGMGLPNIKKCADNLQIKTKIGIGTEVIITVFTSNKECITGLKE